MIVIKTTGNICKRILRHKTNRVYRGRRFMNLWRHVNTVLSNFLFLSLILIFIFEYNKSFRKVKENYYYDWMSEMGSHVACPFCPLSFLHSA